MKKFVLALMLCLASTLSFAGTINYYNRTDETIQMLRDGNPPGIGSNVIPNGFYSETVGYGSYLLSATNGRQTTGGYACTINADNDRCDYTVSIRESYSTTPGLTYVSQVKVNDWTVLSGGPFYRDGVAPYNVFYSPSTVVSEGVMVGVVFEAVPTDGSPIRYTSAGINCRTNQYAYETLDYSTTPPTASELSDIAYIKPNSVMSFLEQILCK